MDVKPAADSSENKSSADSKSGGATTSSGSTRYNRDGRRTTTQKKFQGSNADLLGHVFTTGSTRAGQIHQFSKTDEQIKSVVGQKYNPYVLRSLEAGKLVLPEEPVANADDKGHLTDAEKVRYSKLLDKWIMKKDDILEQMMQVYTLYLGQCDEDIKATIAEHPDFTTVHLNKDVLALYKILQSVSFSYTNSEEPMVSIWKAKSDFMRIRQGKGQSVIDYYERFIALKDVNETLNTLIHEDPGYVDIIATEKGVKVANLSDSGQASFTSKAMSIGRERMLAIHFLHGADQEIYSGLLKTLRHNYLMNKKNDYPTTLQAAYVLLKGWNKGKVSPNKTNSNRTTTGVAFNVNGDESTSTYAGPPCSRCGRDTHPTDKCFAKRHEDGTVLHIDASTDDDQVRLSNHLPYTHAYTHGFTLNTNASGRSSNPIPSTWILLDSQSTVDIFSNHELLRNIHEIDTTLAVKCNAGCRTTNLQGYLSGYGWVWYYPDGIANILSLSRVKEKFRVTFDSTSDNCFYVHKPERILKFREASRRLYYFDTSDRTEESIMLVTTVADNMSKFSAYDITRAKLARSIQKRIGRPSTPEFISIVSSNQLPNCPITVRDIKSAEYIWGPDLGSLKGKQPRTCPDAVRPNLDPIPIAIMEQYRDVTISADIMKVNNIPFLTTISKHIKFGSTGRLDDMKHATLLRHFTTIIKVYQLRGFRVTLLLADNQFASLSTDLATLGVATNIVSRDEHVPDIERYIRTIKDRVRSQYSVLPFNHIPPLLLTELVYAQVFWRNMFVAPDGISTTMSPSEIILNRKIDYNKHCQLEFGDYVQTHEEHDNSLAPRTVGAIATRPTGNIQGGYYFIRLDTGRRISRRRWTSLPMPDLITDQVHRLARRANAARTLTFTNSHDESIDDLYDPNDPDFSEPHESAGVDNAATANNADAYNGNNNYYNILDDENDEPNDTNDEPNDTNDDNDDPDNSNDVNDDDDSTFHPANNDDTESDDELEECPPHNDNTNTYLEPDTQLTKITGVDNNETTGVDNNDTAAVHNQDLEADNTDKQQLNNNTRHSMRLRNTTRPNYKTLATKGIMHDNLIMLQLGINNEIIESSGDDASYTFLNDALEWKKGLHNNEIQNSNTSHEYALVTEQMNWRKGLKIFKDKGEMAIKDELQQIHDVDGFQPKHWHELTAEQRASALKYLMYLKEKRDGRIKGRGCADGRPQRLYTDKHESSSPTASLAGVMLTCLIDAHENRDVATVDIPGAFLQTKMPENEADVHVVLDGRMAELLGKISPSTYKKYIHKHRGQSHIYCKLNVALYGTLKAALLFWNKLTTSLTKRGFTINPYDWCIANKNIAGSQCTIVWHVDDLKISHKDHNVVSDVIASLKTEYEQIGKMTINRGKIHNYLGMTLDYSTAGSITIDMESYIDEVLNETIDIPTMHGTVNTPAAEHLFKIRDNAPKLDEPNADFFHHLVAKLLWVSKRGRPDIQTTIAFLCTRVKQPDEDDYKKLARLIKYLRRTKFLKLTMEAHHLDQNHWFIDGAYAVHNDMKSHSGSFMTFGRGMMDGSSIKQKINTTSSTEAEVVAVHDNMASILWTQYFLDAQGYPMKPSIIHQDNQSAMLLEKNGKGSSSKRTRHMNVRYFFVADCQQRNQVIVTYCPTDKMIGDFFTKPLVGRKFRFFRNIIMNCSTDDYGPVDTNELLQSHYQRLKTSPLPNSID